jgi:hypothetical protein
MALTLDDLNDVFLYLIFKWLLAISRAKGWNRLPERWPL